MEKRKPGALRWLFAAVVIVVVAYVLYVRRDEGAAAQVKTQIREIVKDMDLLPAWESKVLELVDVAHPQTFQKALDVTQQLGRKFDEQVYYDALFDQVITYLREDGMNDVADSIDRQRQHFRLTVTEK